MRVFISAGEPSGDLHASNLIEALREQQPRIEVDGFGGDRMAAAGCRIVYPLCDLAVMGLGQAIKHVPVFRKILHLAESHFAEHRPDAVVMLDYPGFHWWLARAAKRQGIPVVYFVPPQIWAWGGWRIGKMRRYVDRVLCSLPFEKPWYEQRGVAADYVGHPYFDELRGQELDAGFLQEQRARPGEIIAVLPGSRSLELEYNLPTLLRAAELIHAQRPDLRFLVACLKPSHQKAVEERLAGLALPVEVHSRRTAEIIQLAHSCLACSGSVSLELLYRLKPSSIMYRQSRLIILLTRLLKKCPYITLVNLLAEKELFPEWYGNGCHAEEMAGHILGWVRDRAAYEELVAELGALRDRVAAPGACDRAARSVLDLIAERAGRRAA